MKRILILTLCFIGLIACSKKTEEDTSYRQHEYYPVFEKYCSNCHPLSRPLGRKFTARGWEQIVHKMQRKDKNLIPDSAVPKIIQFLQDTRTTP